MKAIFLNPGGIGDQILLLPTVKILKQYYDNITIDLITEPRSACIRDLTSLYRKVIEFDFKSKRIDFLKLRSILRRHKYNFCFITGHSYKANTVAFFSGAIKKIGFEKGIFSGLFLTDPVKINKEQYAAKMFVDLLLPIIPNLHEGVRYKDFIPELNLRPEAISWAREVLTPRVKEKYFAKKILIHPGVSKLSIKKNILKSWSSRNWGLLIEKLLEDPNNIVLLTGGKDDEETIAEINKSLSFFAKPKNFFNLSSIEMNIENLAALISFCDVLLCVDSAPMHIGISLGKRVVSFFGPTNPQKLIPEDNRFIAVYNESLRCRPCLFDVRTESCEQPECLKVPYQKMFEEIQKVLKN